jgi:hypothetical protein
VDEEDVGHLAPTLRAHVNIYGEYHFNMAAGTPSAGLRPLRPPSAASA